MLKLPVLKRIVKNFVEDWVREADTTSAPSSHREERWEYFQGECHHLSRRFIHEFRTQEKSIALVRGHFLCKSCVTGAPTQAVSWHPHFWLVIKNRWIVDVTVEQFVRSKRYVRPITDRRYRPEKVYKRGYYD